MKKNSLSLTSFPSPNFQKGWSSERVPHPSSSSAALSNGSSNGRSHISAATTPFYSGRAVPSKWEDAERWICSPVSGYNNGGVNSNNGSKNLQPQVGGGGGGNNRRVMSKSGPLMQPGFGSSPFSTGVLVPEGVALHYGVIAGGGVNVARPSGLARWPDLVSESSSPSSKDDEKLDLDEMKDAKTMVSDFPSRRDMATQMSREHSTNSSPGERSSSLAIRPVVDSQNDHPAAMEIKEVQVDKRATITSWSKRHGYKTSKKRQPEFFQNSTGTRASSWDITNTTVSLSRYEREEAKITAWENLQKAKAEAAIQKLEMKLEKKRSSSMDRILNKLQTAQMKAQSMRNSMSASQEQQIPNVRHDQQIPKETERRKATFFRKTLSFNSCISCRAL